MKCHACGFIGFDHLSECGNCGGDLTVSRDGLGFVAMKPKVPCFLGSLLKDSQGIAPIQIKEPLGVSPSLSAIPEIEFGDDLQLEGENLEIRGITSSTPGHETMVNPSPGGGNVMDEAVTIDFSEDELHQMVNGNGSEKEMELNLEFLLDEGAPSAAAPPSPGAEVGGIHGGDQVSKGAYDTGEYDSAALELTDEDLAQFADDIESSEKSLSSAVPPADNGNMVLDLSDDDLQNLIADLEAPAEGKGNQMDV
jgi:hypothetical protein